MKNLHKVIIPAARLSGGPKTVFQAHDIVTRRYSEPRLCVGLRRHAVTGAFDWPYPVADIHAVFRIRGMWDMLREMPLSFFNSVDLKTWGEFEVRLNGRRVFQGTVQFMNYRSWRFWPALEFDLAPGALQPGRNEFVIINHTRPFKRLSSAHMPIPRVLLNNTAYHVSDVQLLAFDRQPLHPPENIPAGVWLGHLIGGHEGVHLAEEDFTRTIHLFAQERQGNLLAFLFNSHFCEIDPARINAGLIRQAGLSVAIRNHFNYAGPESHALREAEYNRRLRRFIGALGPNFIGFAPHEQHGAMAKIVAAAPDRDLAAITRAFTERFRQTVMRPIRALAPKAPVWETDPSFYHRYYLAAGTAFPATEFLGTHASLLAAAARGAARAFGLDRWGAINSWECQCYGGLSTRSQDARLDPDFDRKRLNLWWLTQYLLYLGGARTIYSESGAFYHRLTREREWDDPAVEAVRAVQRGLVDFAARRNLRGQPAADIAYLQGKHDIASLTINPAFFKTTGFAPCSWLNLEVCYPEFTMWPELDNAVNFFRPGGCREDTVSHTPFGQADITPVEAAPAALQQHKMLIMSGWNTQTAATQAKLMRYVRQGGVLTVLLPQVTSATSADNPCAHINPRWLRALCGVELAGPADGADAPINRLAPARAWRRQLPEFCRLARRQPETPFYMHVGTYNAMLRNLRIADRRAEAIITETCSGYPFLVERRLGKGRVYLFNLADFTKFPAIYLAINAVLRDLIARLPRAIRLLAGEKVNYFVYPGAPRSGVRCRIYAVATDWHSRSAPGSALFSIFGKKVKVALHRNRVVVIEVKDRGRDRCITVDGSD